MNSDSELLTVAPGGVQTILTTDTSAPQIVYLDFDGASGFGDDDTAELIVHGMDHVGEGLLRYVDSPVTERYIFANVVSSGLKINDRFDVLNVYGTAVSTTVNNYGMMLIYQGGTAIATTLNEKGWLYVYRGGTAVSTTVNMVNDSPSVFRVDGSAVSTTVNSGGSMDVIDGGSAVSTMVNSGGNMNVNDGTAVSTTVNGTLNVNGGTAVSTTVNGTLNVNGGSAVSTTVNGTLKVSNGGTAIATTANGGSITVSSGGTAVNTTIGNLSELTVSSGGTAVSTTVNSGHLYVSSGGTAVSATINGEGFLHVSSGGKIAGQMTFKDGAIVSAYEGAILDFDISGISPSDVALVNDLSVVIDKPFSYTLTVSDTQELGVYRLAEGIVWFNKTVTVMNTLGAELGTFEVGGAVKNGKTKYTLAMDDGCLTVTAQGPTTIFTGDLDYYKDINDWVLASSVNVNEDGLLRILSGGMAEDIALNGGDMEVFDGGTAVKNIINYRCRLFVESGGSVENTTVNSSGWLYVSGGGRADGTTVNQKGSAIVYADGVASGATVNSGGYLRVEQGGAAHDVVENGGGVFVNDGADVTFKPNVFSGLEMTANYTIATVHSGTTANKTTLNGSGVKLEVYNGGTAIDTTVQNGWLEVRGGVAENVAVASGCSLWLYPDARLTGQMTLEEGAVVIANGAVIDFDIASQLTDNAPLVNDLSLIKGTPTFTVTVAESQAEGEYALADGAADFDKTLTVFTASGETLGTITVGDTYVHFGEQAYSLAVSDSQLLFTVGEIDTTPPNAPVAKASTDKPTNKSVTVTATFSDDSVKKEYSLNNKTWKTYPSKGVKMADNGTVWFRATDAAGNVSDVTTYKVANIDKVPPAAPTVSADITTPTNGFVTVTPVFSDDSIQRQVSLDGGVEWVGNIEQIVMTANGWVYFRGIDAAGNISEATGYEVTNIDILPPDAPTAKASTTAPTNQSVTVTATFSDDSVKKEYSLNNKTWKTYPSKGVKMADNGTVWFRGTDAAGNVSHVTTYEVANIDKEPPNEPNFTLSGDSASREIILIATWDRDDAVCLYAVDGAAILQEYVEPLRFSGHAHFHFLTRDAAGNENGRSLEVMSGLVNGVWGAGYRAWRVGMAGETAELEGMNIIGDVFNGSEDSTILLLTDDANGDALFLDDIYSNSPDVSTKARISQINEIIAGAGDDIIDLTSPRFQFADEGIAVQGGDGDDVIWANDCGSMLFGDAGEDRIVGGSGTDVIAGGAGNDSLHGGGGGDYFCFGGSWGDDTVEQADGSMALLWFDGVEREDLSLSADAAGNAVLSCGSGSVTLQGVSHDDVAAAFDAGSKMLTAGIALQFGDNGLDEQNRLVADALRNVGAFKESTSDRIYDDMDRGMLA